MHTIRISARSRKRIRVRRDRQRSRERMTRDYDFQGNYPRNAERTGDWKKWWRAGCGTLPNGVPVCPQGHAYYIARYLRGAHRRSKVLGRRRERRQLNRLVDVD